MDNKEILEAAQRNKTRGNEYENQEFIKSSLLCSIVALIIGSILFLVEYFVKGNVNFSLIIVGLTATAVQLLYEGIKTKKRWLIIAGILQSLLWLVFVMIFVVQVVQ